MTRTRKIMTEKQSNDLMRKNMVDTIANIIGEYNPKLAGMFCNNPFNRKAYAEAFAAGFNSPSHPVAQVVLDATKELRSLRF